MPEEVIYLDHAAATPLDAKVRAAMEPFFSDDFYNPSAPYAPARQVRQRYEAAKQSLARCVGARGDELVITAGATESINLAFSGLQGNGHVVTTTIEHQAVLAAATVHAHTLVPVNAYGRVSAEAIKQALQPDTQLVSVGLANNEIGTLQPLREIADVLKQERARRLAQGNHTPLYFHSDASQGVGQVDVHVGRLGLDLLTVNAAKIYGPKQVGLLWAAPHVELQPAVLGGGQERGLRSGTENVPGTVGFAVALQQATDHRSYEAKRLTDIRNSMATRLEREFPEMIISGHPKYRLAGHLHVSFPNLDAERIVFALEMRGVLVATGSACAANKGTRSHVLTAIGLTPEVADGSLRLTFGHLSTPENTARATDILIEEIHKEYQRSQK